MYVALYLLKTFLVVPTYCTFVIAPRITIPNMKIVIIELDSQRFRIASVEYMIIFISLKLIVTQRLEAF